MSLNVRWIKAPFDSEIDEFKSLSRYLNIPLPALVKAYAAKKSPTILYASMWQKIENTDSWRVKDFSQLNELLTAYRRTSESLAFLLDSLLLKKTCQLPIMVAYVNKQGNQKVILVAGNTRLCLCKLLRIQPKVIMLDMISYGDDL